MNLTMHHAHVLAHIAGGGVPVKRSDRHMFYKFTDLQVAFDSVSSRKLWEKLQATSTPPRLLDLIKHLYIFSYPYLDFPG